MHQPDPVLGWKNKPGRYLFPAYVLNGPDIKISILPDGTRSAGQEHPDGRSKLAILGGSTTQGSAISDNQTYPWKLQSQYPSVRVLNYGTAAYGTYQSLLVLERILADPNPPQFVLYGFIGHHEVRNIATFRWMRTLSSHSRRGHVYLPYVHLDSEGHLIRHSPEKYPEWPLRESVVSVNFFQNLFFRLKTRTRGSQKRKVTEMLLLEMDNLSRQKDVIFTVVLLLFSEEARSHYINFLRNNAVNFLDCVYPITPEMRVPGEGHTNGIINTLWANCIAEGITDTASINTKDIKHLGIDDKSN